ncbi:tail fiber assembly protein [Chromobacterium haemolyticum]|uniref:Tail fiber assembly protein n=1 Tax=Chromobacterium fluminis TaxID=3044269 RepID=A0ABX0L8A6_9NEIS|nr:tail fiber assembly protein [Chromobacterium haemolyticum]NHR08064.1 tail fiber assembly protein [Chromobacterium haemolyticum]
MNKQKSVYAYHPDTGEFLGITTANLSPLDVEETWLIPAHATEQEPPPAGDKQVAVYRDNGWQLAADFRTIKLWSQASAQPVTAKIGDTPDSLQATELEPPSFAIWVGRGWQIDAVAQRAAQALTVEAETASRRAVADAAIVPLEDAVELEMATPAELAAMKSWKRYRVMLSRVPQQPGYPAAIEWPTAP